MSKIKNGGLDQYGIVYRLNGIGGERVNLFYRTKFSMIVNTLLEEFHK